MSGEEKKRVPGSVVGGKSNHGTVTMSFVVEGELKRFAFKFPCVAPFISEEATLHYADSAQLEPGIPHAITGSISPSDFEFTFDNDVLVTGSLRPPFTFAVDANSFWENA